MIEAFDTYIKYVPDAPELPKIKYRKARIYYEDNHFNEALPLFKDIAENHPRLGARHLLGEPAVRLPGDPEEVRRSCRPTTRSSDCPRSTSSRRPRADQGAVTF